MKNLRNSVLAGALIPLLGFLPALDAHTQDSDDDPSSIREMLVVTQTNTLLPISSPMGPERVAQTIRLYVTGYSSTPEQTDDTPFITASGKKVRDGIVATNLLPMGTKVKIPEIYGNKVFVVEDRMNSRLQNHIDIWFPTYFEAKHFGIRVSNIVVLES